MLIRKRSWTTSKGQPKEAWVVDYVDQAGRRHLKTFARKKDADDIDLRRFTIRLGKDEGTWTSRHHRGSETSCSELRGDLSRLPVFDFAFGI